MFGKILSTSENTIEIENLSHQIPIFLKGIHVSFTEEERTIIGKIVDVTKEQFTVLLIGEIVSNVFITGIYQSPKLINPPRIVNAQELQTFIGNQNFHNKETLLIGTSTLYPNFHVTVSLNDFFSNHFAIIGNSGFGKSCGVARLIQNAFYYNEIPPKNAHIILFDVYGEYQNAFKNFERIPGIHVKNYQNKREDIANVITIPPYFLDADDLAILLNVEDPFLIPILEKALQYVGIFKSEDPSAEEYKNSIIANCLLEVLASGKEASQIRDQTLSILAKYNTQELNENSMIKELGYNRTLRQCLNIDEQGKINAISKVIEFLNEFKKNNSDNFAVVPNLVYTLEDICDALEFALLAEGVYNSVSMYERAMTLKVHLQQVINGPYKKFFEYPYAISKADYVKSLFTADNGEVAQIVNVNLDSMEDRFAKILTKLYSKLFFDFATSLENRGSFPINIILEEAHRYVNNDKDAEIIGYNIFDRITKEGRKYGVLMGFITQRPSELSKTALSQCSNFLVFRIFHPEDYKMIDAITSSITREELERLKTLRKGIALVFGSALAIPMLAKLEMPDPPPLSSNVNVSQLWFN